MRREVQDQLIDTERRIKRCLADANAAWQHMIGLVRLRPGAVEDDLAVLAEEDTRERLQRALDELLARAAELRKHMARRRELRGQLSGEDRE